jgi:hypothetical protein
MTITQFQIQTVCEMFLGSLATKLHMVCLKSLVNGTRKQTKQALDQGITVDFFLFPRLKSIMKGARFVDVAAIQECVTAVLKLIPREAFADSFQKLYERCQQCVVKDGDYFKGQ